MQVIHKKFTFCVLDLNTSVMAPSSLRPCSLTRCPVGAGPRRGTAAAGPEKTYGEDRGRGTGTVVGESNGKLGAKLTSPPAAAASWIGRATDRARQRAGGRADGGAGA